MLPDVGTSFTECKIKVDAVLLAKPILILYQLLHGREVRVIRGNPIAVHEVEIMGTAAGRQRHRFLKSGTRFSDPTEFGEKPAEIAMDYIVLGRKRNRLYIMCDRGLWHALSYNNLGDTLANLGNTEEAEARLRQAIDLNPNYAEAYYNLANALRARGKLEEAVAHYRHALALMPNFVVALNNLGVTLSRQGKPEEAAAQFERVIQLESHNAGAHYNLGNILREKANYAAAIAHYQQALAQRPDYADAWNNMGATFAEQGDINAAREAYEKAVKADPTRAAYHRNLASSKRFESSDDPQLVVIEKLALDTASVPESERMCVLSSLSG